MAAKYLEVKLESQQVNRFLEDSNMHMQAVTSPCVRFEDLNLSPELLKGLHVEMKFERPSKIQSVCLPMILTPPYKNLIAQAPDYSGKTTCSVLGMLSRVDPDLHAPQAICLCPTRPFAIQNMLVLLKMGKFNGITSELCLPPTTAESCRPDFNANHIPITKRAPVTAQVVIGSPGTIDNLIALNKLPTSNLKILVFEEAYHMAEDGVYGKYCARIMKEIVRWSPKCQALLFLATFDDCVKTFVSTIAEDPFVQEFHHLSVPKEELSLDSVKQYKVNLPDELSKITLIKDKIMALGQTHIFVRTRKTAEMLHEALVKCGYAVTTIYTAVAQTDHDKVIREFEDGLTRVLISGDILDQVFDLCQANLVVNYDLPYTSQDYLRRVGRAGRFGPKGVAFTLLCGDRDNMITEKFERRLKYNATEMQSWNSDGDFKDALEKAGLK